MQQPLRPVFECAAAIAWMVCGVALAAAIVRTHEGGVALRLSVWVLGMLAWRTCAAWRRYAFKIRLCGAGTAILPAADLEVVRQRAPDQVWLGWGYRWEPAQAQLAHDLLAGQPGSAAAPAWVRHLAGAPHPDAARGLPWIHGLAQERDLLVPLRAFEGHTAILAVTGAMKTVLARLLVYQLAARGDTVIVIDPKGDRDLEALCREVPAALGQPERALSFRPAFPDDSMRYDALASWDRETQVASRLRLLLPGADDNFIGFAWMTVTRLVCAMAFLGRRPTLAGLLDHLQSRERAEALACAVLERFLGPPAPGVQAGRPARGPYENPSLAAAVARLRGRQASKPEPPAVTAILAMLESDRAWFDKMTIALTPTLTKLCAGSLRDLLSPDCEDIEDARPIVCARRLIEGRRVAYFGLDALGDPAVAEAIAALVLADLAATAGELYSHALPEQLRSQRIHVLCDEWGDVVCDPLIQLANKARGAGVMLYLFGQTLSDLVVKLGNEHKALRVLGNMNNLIVGATSDTGTLELVTARLGETAVRQATLQHADARHSGSAGLQAGSTRAVSIGVQAAARVPAALLAGLPDLQFFAILDRARIHKVRIPVLQL